MRTCCIYVVRMSVSAPAKRPPAADRVYAHVKQGVLERTYEGDSSHKSINMRFSL